MAGRVLKLGEEWPSANRMNHSDLYAGVMMFAGTVQSTGDATITINGTGGAAEDQNEGVFLDDAGCQSYSANRVSGWISLL